MDQVRAGNRTDGHGPHDDRQGPATVLWLGEVNRCETRLERGGGARADARGADDEQEKGAGDHREDHGDGPQEGGQRQRRQPGAQGHDRGHGTRPGGGARELHREGLQQGS